MLLAWRMALWVEFKANWTSAANVEAFLDRYLTARGQRGKQVPLAMYKTEQAASPSSWSALAGSGCPKPTQK